MPKQTGNGPGRCGSTFTIYERASYWVCEETFARNIGARDSNMCKIFPAVTYSNIVCVFVLSLSPAPSSTTTTSRTSILPSQKK